MTFGKSANILKQEKSCFHTKLDYFLYIVTFSKMNLGPLPHLRWSSLEQIVMVRFTNNV